MKAGLTIEELATEVMRQKDAKADYIVNTSMLAMEHCGTELVLRVLDDSHIDRIEPLCAVGNVKQRGQKRDHASHFGLNFYKF